MNEYSDLDRLAAEGGVAVRARDALRLAARHAPSRLYLERSDTACSDWLLATSRSTSQSTSQSTSPASPSTDHGWTRIASVPSHEVRMLLAFFGAALMRDQLYGGFCRSVVLVDGTALSTTIYMSNDNRIGHWLSAYIHGEVPRNRHN